MEIPEKVAKKIGEAHAFALVLQDLHAKTPKVLTELLEGHAESIPDTAFRQITDLTRIAEAGEVGDMVLEKANRTREKITNMGDTYVGDDWDDPAEVLEWLSFFLGAAVIHWQLIAGSAKQLADEDFENIAVGGAAYYAELLEAARLKAESIGRVRAQA